METTHYLVALDENGDTIEVLEAFQDWGLALEESGLLNEALMNGRTYTYAGRAAVGFEVVTEQTG